MLRIGVAVAVLAVGAVGCTDERDRFKDTVLDAIAKTERAPRRLLYAQTDALGAAIVRAAVADDLQYKAEVEINGRATAEEVASDDALAVRFADPTRLVRFLSRDAAAVVAPSPIAPEQAGTFPGGPAPVDVTQAPLAAIRPLSKEADQGLRSLTERRWVLDRAGAPDLFTIDRSALVGEDPVLDALEVLAYVRRTIDEHGVLVPYNPDSVAYRPDEDPFPRPELDSGVERYDTLQPDLPRASETTDTGSRPLPEARHFRKLSVYVKDGFVIAVRERIDVVSRVDDLREAYEVSFPKGLAGAELEQALLTSINTMRLTEGRDPLRLRTMSVEYRDFGATIAVALPSEVVEGDLSALRRRGTANVNATAVVAEEDEAAPVAPAPAAPSAPAA